MLRFYSPIEKRLWLCTALVLGAILTSLFLDRRVQRLILEQQLQAYLFVLGLALTGIATLWYGLKSKESNMFWLVGIGLAAVYSMFLFRLGAAERSHMIEYSVLALLLHAVLAERSRHRKLRIHALYLAGGIALLIGLLDECAQLFLPNRSFDAEDIVFNCLAILLTLGTTQVLAWMRRWRNRNKST